MANPRLVATAVAVVLAAAAFSPAAADSQGFASVFAASEVHVYPRISVEVVGSGPDVVLIPGWSNSREVWRETAERLRGRYRLHLVQIAGFAGEPPRANASGEVLVPSAQAIDDYIRDEGLVRPAVIGHSMGESIALWLAEHHPGDIGRALIVDAIPAQTLVPGGAHGPPSRDKAAAMRANIERIDFKDPYMHQRLLYRMSLLTTSNEGERILGWSAAGDPLVSAQAYYDLGLLDLRPALGTVRVPVTLMFPVDKDLPEGVAPDERVYRAAYAALPHVRLVRIDGSRHYIMYDQPAVFEKQVAAFLRRPEVPRG